MKHLTIATILFAAACGGGKKPDTTTADQQPMANTEPEPAPAPAPEPAPAPAPAPEPAPAPPPPPKMFSARADLAPVKGAKQKAAAVVFTQTEGQDQTSVKLEGAFDGLKAGKYHLVIHEGADCGPNATKVGKVWAAAAASPLGFDVAKDAPASLDTSVALKVDGDGAVVGHTIVLHADKKGKPGKALACGTVTKAEAAAGGAAPSSP